MGPDLFNQSEPCEVRVTIGSSSGGPTDDYRGVSLFIRIPGRPGLAANGIVGRYSPEDEIFEGIARTMKILLEVQETPTMATVREALHAGLKDVPPF